MLRALVGRVRAAAFESFFHHPTFLNRAQKIFFPVAWFWIRINRIFRITDNVVGRGGIVLMEMNTFYALFNKNLPFQTRVTMVNPENPANPDPNNWLRHAPSKLRPNT
jgi:hypothetical protein